MTMNMKIVLFVAIAFILSFSSLCVFQTWSESYVDIFRLEKEFFSTSVDPNEKKILVIGSSEIGMINATYVNEHLNKPGFVVYNLAIPSDTPTQRLRLVDKTLALHPTLVVYGVGYRDFANKSTLIKSEETLRDKILPSLGDLLKHNSLLHKINEATNLDSPKFVTVQVLNKLTIFTKQTPQNPLFLRMNYTPFDTYTIQEQFVKNDIDLQKTFAEHPPDLGYIDSPTSNEEVLALEQIIEVLAKNHIKVIIVATPHAKIFHQNLDEHNKLVYDQILAQISKRNVTVYDLNTKYQDLNVWYDYHHVSINPKIVIFNNDIVTIIQNMLG